MQSERVDRNESTPATSKVTSGQGQVELQVERASIDPRPAATATATQPPPLDLCFPALGSETTMESAAIMKQQMTCRLPLKTARDLKGAR